MELKDNGIIEQKDRKVSRYRCRKWLLRVRTDQGRKSRYFVGTLTEAKHALNEYMVELTEQKKDSSTFGEYSNKWLNWRKKANTFSPNTIEKDERLIRGLNVYLSDVPLNRITTLMIKDKMAEFRSPAGNKVANTYKRMYFAELKKILNSAKADSLIPTNPMNGIDLPKNDTPEKRVLTKKELFNLINILENTKLDGRVIATLFMCYLALRRAEAIALTWDNIDFTKQELSITQAYKNADKSIGIPKSIAGKRKLPIPNTFIMVLQKWRIQLNKLDDSCMLVCPDTKLTLIEPTNLRKWFVRFCKMNDLEHISFHELRHSNLTYVARNMSQFDLQRYAGWSSLEPAKIYIHDDYESMKNSLTKLF